uniref:NADH-ubiquinone oxidoreductase chain 6 n=1 Tax=Empis separata TaxID=2803750 RepID=A0A7T8V820_9MUSC|nr:NADH dehydrogenase subunit 6 [Empis separata]QQQ89193.1 NADH dehydrogenase subunit 6 [Empis separata]
MTQLILMLSILISSFIFMQMNHPLAMGLMLLIQTLLICLLTGLMAKNFWFSYILFLIFIGGMLVLFIYVTSLASNEMFSMSMNLIIFSVLFFMLAMMMFIIMDKLTIMNILLNNEMNSIFNLNSFLNENMLNLNKLYNFPTNFLTLLIINYLLITLIAIVKITNMFYGPLRLMN